MTVKLSKVGQIIVERKQVCWRECQVCGLPASWRITFLASENCRSNPTSKAFGRDDCSWCSDAEDYACKKHEREVGNNAPAGMNWCASFPLKRFKHMGFYIITLPERGLIG